MRGFRDRRAAVEFCILSLATFLCFTTVQQTGLLAVVMQNHGMPLPQIGIVLGVYGAAVVFFMLAGAPLAARIGNLQALRLGLALLVAGHMSYQWTIGDFPAAILSRCVQGAGYGFFFPAAMTFAKNKLTKDRFVYLFGIYSSMVSLPNGIGPPVAEAYLHHFGEHLFFIVGALPGLIAVGVTLWLREEGRMAGGDAALPLLQTAILPTLRQPLVAILVVGAIYGLIPSYMAALLGHKSIPIGFFFTSFTVVFFGSRFVLIGWIEALPHRRLVAAGTMAMAAAYVVIAWATGAMPVTLAGVLFGLGYSVAYPVLSVWVAEQFAPAQRTTPVVLFNTVFSFGILLTPWLGSWVIARLDYQGLLLALATAGLVLAAGMLLAGKAKQSGPAGLACPKQIRVCAPVTGAQARLNECE
jgi:MFS family permease